MRSPETQATFLFLAFVVGLLLLMLSLIMPEGIKSWFGVLDGVEIKRDWVRIAAVALVVGSASAAWLRTKKYKAEVHDFDLDFDASGIRFRNCCVRYGKGGSSEEVGDLALSWAEVKEVWPTDRRLVTTSGQVFGTNVPANILTEETWYRIAEQLEEARI